jgi:hypothetical protein
MAPDPTTPFTKCPTCKALVVSHCWHHKDGTHPGPYWQPLPAPVTPALGLPHTCPPAAEKERP